MCVCVCVCIVYNNLDLAVADLSLRRPAFYPGPVRVRYALDRGQWYMPQSLSLHQCPIPTSNFMLHLSNNKRGSPGTIKQSSPLSYVGGPLE